MERGSPVVTDAGGDGGTRLLADRYELGELLGSGGMADVYDAVDTRLRRPVAVKLLRPSLAADPKVRLRFEAEARSAARLSHPNVVAVFDTGEDEGTPFIVMERLPGDTLADRKGGAMDPDAVVRLAGDVLGALGAAHAAGIVHRDVKPANILLAADGCAKVGDFGIAKSIQSDDTGEMTRTDILIGTPAYLAPERIDGHEATARSDLYSLGVVLYELLGGERAYTGSTPVAVATAVKTHTPPPLDHVRPGLPHHIVAAVHRAMSADPAARFASAAEMAAALGSGLAGSGPGDDATVALAQPAGAASTTTTMPRQAVAGAGAERTETVRRPEGGAEIAALAARRHAGRRFRMAAAAVAVLVFVLVGVAVASNDRDGGGTGGGPQAAAADPARAQLAAEMREWADRMETGDGSKGPEAASRLRTVADEVEAGGGAEEATALANDAVQWRRSNELFRTATARLLELLARVPGAQPVALPTDTTAAPLVQVQVGDEGDNDEKDEKRKGEGKGEGEGKDDD